MKFKLSLFVLLSLCLFTYGQEEAFTNNLIKSSSISIGFGGSQFVIGIEYSQMLTERISAQIGTGILSSGAGMYFFITNPRLNRFNIYSGLTGIITYDGDPIGYLPVGISYLGKNNFQYNFDVGIMAYEGYITEGVNLYYTGKPSFDPWLGLRVGYRFGEDISIRKEVQKTGLKNIIGLNLGGYDVFAGLYYERLIKPSWGVEAGFGLIGLSMGSKLYFPSISAGHLSFHIGVSESTGIIPLQGYTGFKTYFPIGINILTAKKFRYSLDAGPQIWHWDNNDILPSVSIRIGKAF